MHRENTILPLAGIVLICITGALSELTGKLPTPWRLRANGVNRSFRISTEVHVTSSGQSFILEESASEAPGGFRLNVIDKSNGNTETYLKLLPTQEIFKFKPFTCSLLREAKDVLEGELNKLFPSSDSWLISGVSSLWAYALNRGAEFSRAVSQSDSNLNGKQILKTFDRYDVLKSVELPYNLRFFFPANQEDRNSPSIIQVSEGDGVTERVVLRIRTLEFESPLASNGDENSNMFALPLGYGCQRKIMFNYISPITFQDFPMKPQKIKLEFAHTEKPSTQSLSIDIIFGSIRVDEGVSGYYVVEASSQSSSTSLNKLSKQKTKKVWHFKRINDESKPTHGSYFEVDESKSKCLDIGEGSYKNSATFMISFRGANNFMHPAGENYNPEGTWHAGLPLDADKLRELFSGTDGFHLLRESALTWSLKTQTVEKRLNNFTLRDKRGDIVWIGSVSIVREHFSDESLSYTDTASRGNVPPRVDATLIFLSREDDKVIAQAKLSLISQEFTTVAHLHQRLDVSPCLVKSAEYLLGIGSARGHVGFRIGFSPESDIENISGLSLQEAEEFKATIYEDILASIFFSLPTEPRLDPLQIVDIEVSTKEGLLIVTGAILDASRLLDYKRENGVRFAAPSKVPSILREIKSNEEECAEICSLYNCKTFAYCQDDNTCDLNLRDNPVALRLVSKCGLYSLMENHMTHVEPIEFLKAVKRKVLSNTSRGQFLHITGSLRGETIVCGADFIDIYDYTRHYGPGSATRETARFQTQSLVNSDGRETERMQMVRAEYEILFDDRDYPENLHFQQNGLFPLGKTNVKSLSDCGNLCSSTDCRSFSYCRLGKTCMVSLLHLTDDVRHSSVSSVACLIMARESLSKFSSVPSVVELIEIHQRIVNGADRRLCASECVEEKEFDCRFFQLCVNKENQQAVCYLSSRQDFKQLSVGSSSHSQECESYKRSAISEFSILYERSLPKERSDHIELLSFQKIQSADDCAVECLDKGIKCIGFEVCHDQLAIDGFIECSIAMSPETLSAEQLSHSTGCTTFLWKSERKHLIDGEQVSTSKELGMQDIMFSFMLILTGIFGGYVFCCISKKIYAWLRRT